MASILLSLAGLPCCTYMYLMGCSIEVLGLEGAPNRNIKIGWLPLLEVRVVSIPRSAVPLSTVLFVNCVAVVLEQGVPDGVAEGVVQKEIDRDVMNLNIFYMGVTECLYSDKVPLKLYFLIINLIRSRYNGKGVTHMYLFKKDSEQVIKTFAKWMWM